jgi:hypothetical protein
VTSPPESPSDVPAPRKNARTRKIVLAVVLAIVLVCGCCGVSLVWEGGPLDRFMCADSQPNSLHNWGCPYQVEDFDCDYVDAHGEAHGCEVDWDKVRENH